MSTIAVNQITDASGGSTAQINGITPTAYNTMGRNRIINGAMEISQRGTSWTGSPNEYTLDRWKVEAAAQDGSITVSQSSTAPAGFKNSLLVTVNTADASITASQFARVRHFVEGINIVDWGFGTASAKPLTLSFWVKSSLTGTFSFAMRNAAGNRSYPTTYSISAANTWEYKTISIPGDTSGTWDTSTTTGVSLFFTLASGSDWDDVAGAWTASGASAAEGCVNVLGTTGATIQWTGVQLEVGSVATEFERRPYGTELALCQRYCYKTTNSGGGYAAISSGAMYQASEYYGYTQFPITMRSSPTATFSSASEFTIVTTTGTSCTTIEISSSCPSSARIRAVPSSARTAGHGAWVQYENTTTTFAMFTAEL